jgi:hypothetical protein
MDWAPRRGGSGAPAPGRRGGAPGGSWAYLDAQAGGTTARLYFLLSYSGRDAGSALDRLFRILDHLGLSPSENEKPPLPVPEVVRVPVNDDGWEIAAPL